MLLLENCHIYCQPMLDFVKEGWRIEVIGGKSPITSMGWREKDEKRA